MKVVRDPGGTARAAREAAEGIGEIVWAGLNPAPETPLNVPIGPHRRVWSVRSSLADFKAIKDALGGTVNDVVLAVVSGALGRWLRTRGVRTEGLELRALVPVSIRPPGAESDLGNQIAAMRGPLPVYAIDPIDRLEIVKESMGHLKQSKQALGAEVIAGLNDFAPPTLLAQASRLNFSTRLFNLIVTNVPGPQFPLYLLGRELQELAPIAFLPEDHALAVATMSYNGCIDFGLLGDYDAMPDLDVFADYLDDALAELMEAAGVGKPTGRVSSPGRTSRPRSSDPESTVARTSSSGEPPHALELPDVLLHLLGHLGADRAAGRGEREGDVDLAVLDLDLVDQPQLDEVEAQLGVDHVRERVVDVLFGRHEANVSQR